VTTPDEAIVLYHWPKTRSTIVRWMLEEVGVPYAIELVDLTKGEQNTPAYRALNQIGKVPTLRHGKTIISEVSAICCYLADRFPQAGLAPAIDHPLRGPYLKWLFFAPGCIEPAVIHKAMKWPDGPRGTIGWASYDDTIQVLADAVVNATPWLLGDKFTAADVVVGAQIRWGLQFATIPKHPAFEAYAHRLAERPALQRQIAADTTG
jgi:glutathione S-transferase